MKIISDFRDYYDGIVAYGFDDSVIYHRKHQICELNGRVTKISDVPLGKYEFRFAEYHRRFVVSFCSKSYVGYAIAEPSRISYNPEEIEQLVESERRFPLGARWFFYTYKDQFDETGFNGQSFAALHREYRSPILAKVGGTLHINPILKDLEFFRVVDPYTAFQEIETFISALIGMEVPPTVEISDQSKILKHGYDPKYSFRKLPESSKNSKKTRRKQN